MMKMGYEPFNWQYEDQITPERLNHIENTLSELVGLYVELVE